MKWLPMSERDLRRIEVFSDVRTELDTIATAAAVLAVIVGPVRGRGRQRADLQGARQDVEPEHHPHDGHCDNHGDVQFVRYLERRNSRAGA